MKKFYVTIARSQMEYGAVTVEAESADAAEDQVAEILKDTSYSEAYCTLVNGVKWNLGDHAENERVIEVEEIEETSEDTRRFSR